MKELIFEVREDEADGGYVASGIGEGIHAEADTLEDLKRNIRDAVGCHYDDPADRPGIIRLRRIIPR
jgi:predicted RNase H-like HicB family nuclease